MVRAQIWDTVMDQYDRSPSAELKRQINDVYDGFVKVYPDWTTNMYNDDIIWWAIAWRGPTRSPAKIAI